MGDRINYRIWGWLYRWQKHRHVKAAILYSSASLCYLASVKPPRPESEAGEHFLSEVNRAIAGVIASTSGQNVVLGVVSACDSVLEMTQGARSFEDWLKGSNVVADLLWWARVSRRGNVLRRMWPRGRGREGC